MKKFVLFFLAIGLLIPLFSVPTSAASYDLGNPKRLSYTVAINTNVETFPFADIYSFDPDDRSVDFYNYQIGSYNPYFRYANTYRGFDADLTYFSFGVQPDYDSLARHIEVTGFEYNDNFITYSNILSVRNKLFFVGLVYENLFLPSDGQYLRIDFSFDSALIQAPTEILNIFNLNDLCFLCDTSGRAGYNDRYSLPKILPSSATVLKNGNVYSYSYFFNLTPNALSNISDADNICLAIRIPYYFNSASSFDGGVWIVSNAELPLTYEILTVGGYDQALEDIRDSLDSLKTDLVDFYTDQSSADIGYISRGQAINTQVTNSIGEYNEALKPLDSLREDYTAPPAAQQVQQQLSNMDTEDVKRFFSVPWIVSALGLVFTFSVIRLILYGTKEG